MPHIKYIDKKLGQAKLDATTTANAIIAQYRAQGYDLTLRQLYYQFVARGLIANSDREYKRLGAAISDGRMCGLVDWDAIVDRTRNVRRNSHWESPQEIVRSCASQYRIDRWEYQLRRPEVWIEKDALVGVIERVCTELDVPYFSCRGYTSQSEMWAASQRLLRYREEFGQEPWVLHLGDHDPSGIDMTRDVEDRLATFMGGVPVKRLALNWDQVQHYTPPPNPAKFTDSRAKDYVAHYGTESWELDALDPAVIADLIRDAVKSLRDEKMWKVAIEREEKAREQLRDVADRWDEIVPGPEGNPR